MVYRTGQNRDRARALREADPTRTLADIGRELGISRAAVHQLLKRQNLPTRHVRVETEQRKCAHCKQPTTPGREYCNECRTIIVPCSACGQPITMRRALYDYMKDVKHQKHFYHTRICFFEGVKAGLSSRKQHERIL